jgi:hypothetical protein
VRPGCMGDLLLVFSKVTVADVPVVQPAAATHVKTFGWQACAAAAQRTGEDRDMERASGGRVACWECFAGGGCRVVQGKCPDDSEIEFCFCSCQWIRVSGVPWRPDV